MHPSFTQFMAYKALCQVNFIDLELNIILDSNETYYFINPLRFYFVIL